MAGLQPDPERIARGAVDRLCDYGEDRDWTSTRDLLAEFQRHFIAIAAERMALVARGEPPTEQDSA